MQKTQTTLDTAVYIGTYSKYTNGSLFGQWFYLSDYLDAEELHSAILSLHSTEEDPELMIQDSEGIFSNMISECFEIDTFVKIYEIVDEANNQYIDLEVIEAYCDIMSVDIIEVNISDVQASFVGYYDNDEDFAYSFADDMGYLDKNQSWPYDCIDWSHAARELMYDYRKINGYYFRKY